FQAGDGIRDFHVTGVQTCALPILLRHSTTRVFLRTDSIRASWSAATSSLEAELSRLELIRPVKLGAAMLASTANTARVTINSTSVKPSRRVLARWPFIPLPQCPMGRIGPAARQGTVDPTSGVPEGSDGTPQAHHRTCLPCLGAVRARSLRGCRETTAS